MAAINNDRVNNAEEDADENRRASDQSDPEMAEKRSTRAPWRSTVSFWWRLDDFERRRRLGRSLFLRYFVHHLGRGLRGLVGSRLIRIDFGVRSESRKYFSPHW